MHFDQKNINNLQDISKVIHGEGCTFSSPATLLLHHISALGKSKEMQCELWHIIE